MSEPLDEPLVSSGRARAPGLLDRDLQVPLLLVLVSFGVALWVTGYGMGSSLLRLYGAFFVVYPGLLVAGLLDIPWLNYQVDRFIEKWVRDTRKGFYGMMVAVVFISSEVKMLLDWLVPFVQGARSAAGLFVSWLLSFGIDSLLNALTALIWPIRVFPAEGVLAGAILVAVCWSAFALGRRLFSTPVWLLEEEAEEQASGSGRSADAEA